LTSAAVGSYNYTLNFSPPRVYYISVLSCDAFAMGQNVICYELRHKVITMLRTIMKGHKNGFISKLSEGKFQEINRGEKIEHDDEMEGKENKV
jgi:hypothetical protein